jgi:hypothetical protein
MGRLRSPTKQMLGAFWTTAVIDFIRYPLQA